MMSGAAKPVGTLDHLIGAYACYSHAWSPYFEDRIIRGSLVVDVTSG